MYRYAFNGKEKDPEFQNNYDYGFRIYNANIAKFLSVDPIESEYPNLTPYQFASNTPIQAIDQDGLEKARIEYGGNGLGSFVPASDNLYNKGAIFLKNGTKPILKQQTEVSVFTVRQTYISADKRSAFEKRQAELNTQAIKNNQKIREAQQLDPTSHQIAGGILAGLAESPSIIIPELKIGSGYSFLKSSTLKFGAGASLEFSAQTFSGGNYDAFDIGSAGISTLGLKGQVFDMVAAPAFDLNDEGLKSIFNGKKNLTNFGVDLGVKSLVTFGSNKLSSSLNGTNPLKSSLNLRSQFIFDVGTATFGNMVNNAVNNNISKPETTSVVPHPTSVVNYPK